MAGLGESDRVRSGERSSHSRDSGTPRFESTGRLSQHEGNSAVRSGLGRQRMAPARYFSRSDPTGIGHRKEGAGTDERRKRYCQSCWYQAGGWILRNGPGSRGLAQGTTHHSSDRPCWPLMHGADLVAERRSQDDEISLDEPYLSIRWRGVPRILYAEWKGFATSAELRSALLGGGRGVSQTPLPC